MKIRTAFSTALLGLTLAVAACKSPNRAAYIAVGATTATVNQAIPAFNKWSKDHPLTLEQKQAYANLLKAYVDAVEVVRASEAAAQNGLASPEAQASLDTAIGNIIEFINSIAPLVVKPSTTH